MYYWDSYWVVRGLLLCDMFDTARGIIENMVFMVKLYGHVPNGNRKYYLQRSQPPLLIQMAATYHSCTKDHKFIHQNLEVRGVHICVHFRVFFVAEIDCYILRCYDHGHVSVF